LPNYLTIITYTETGDIILISLYFICPLITEDIFDINAFITGSFS